MIIIIIVHLIIVTTWLIWPLIGIASRPKFRSIMASFLLHSQVRVKTINVLPASSCNRYTKAQSYHAKEKQVRNSIKYQSHQCYIARQDTASSNSLVPWPLQAQTYIAVSVYLQLYILKKLQPVEHIFIITSYDVFLFQIHASKYFNKYRYKTKVLQIQLLAFAGFLRQARWSFATCITK